MRLDFIKTILPITPLALQVFRRVWSFVGQKRVFKDEKVKWEKSLLFSLYVKTESLKFVEWIAK